MECSVSLSDTVGFIRELPHGLVEAFEATLQEAVDADLLLHVVDGSSPAWVEQIAEVQQVLAEIGADHIPQLLVFNKLDAIPPERRPRTLVDTYEVDHRQIPRVHVSAREGLGLDAVREAMADAVRTRREAASRTLADDAHADPLRPLD